MYYLDEARKLYEQTNLNPTMYKVDQRLQLLKSLKENDKQNQWNIQGALIVTTFTMYAHW